MIKNQTKTVLLIVSLSIVLAWTELSYAATVQVDVCQWIVKKVPIPATYQDVITCDNSAKMCAFVDASCCVPAVCNTLPHCLITKTTLDVAMHYADQTVFDCNLKDLDPAVEFGKWLRRQIPSLDDLLLPGAFIVAKADIEAMKLAASPLPSGVKTQIRGLIQPSITAGTAKFSQRHIDSVKIISDSNTNAGLYRWAGYGAITLDDLVILNKVDFDLLRNTTHHNHQVSEINSGVAPADYSDALLLMLHELVHVKQYENLGLDAFLTNYLIKAISTGYGSDAFEREAYEFELEIARTVVGTQSVELAAVRATTVALGVNPELTLNARSIARWERVAIWFEKCVNGKQMTTDPQGQQVPIAEKECAPKAVTDFRLNIDRSRNFARPEIPRRNPAGPEVPRRN